MIVFILATLRRSWQAHFWINFATTGVLALSFSLILGTALLTTNLGRLLSVWGDEIQITIYLKDDISADQKQKIETLLKTEDGVEGTHYLDKNDAAAAFEKSLKTYGPNFLKSIKDSDNPFPASYLVQMTKAKKTPENVELVAHKFSELPGVEDVSYGQEWLKNYSRLLRLSRSIAIIFALIILIGCLFTVSNSVRASLSSRREEVEILELVGATPVAIRRPFLIEGAFQGFVATGASIFILQAAYWTFYEMLEGILGSSSVVSSMSFFPHFSLILFLIGGAVVGALGSYLCVASINTGWAAARAAKA